MHNSLTGLPTRAVVDTNILLSGCFVRGSASHHALVRLHRLGYTPVIDDAIEEEALAVLRKLRLRLGLSFDPASLLLESFAVNGILKLPRADQRYFREVNRADQHVVSAAKHYDAWILTGDVQLAAQCQCTNILVRLPWDVILEADTMNGMQPTLAHTLHVVGASLKSGSIFARAIAGAWADNPHDARHTLCDVEHVARLYYDSKTQAWVFSMAFGAEARLKCKLKNDEHWMVCGSYETNTAKVTSITLRATLVGGHPVYESVTAKGGLSAQGPGIASCGHTVNGLDYGNWYIRKIIISPIAINAKSWSALVKVPEAAPDPSLIRTVEAALIKMQQSPNHRMYSASEILTDWI